MKKATVVHHSADFDGLFSREVSKHFLGTDGVEYIGWDYIDAKIPFPSEGTVYVIDLAPDCFLQMPGVDEAKERVVWIDHHKSAIEKWGTYLPGLRIDGVAACRLAYQWFFQGCHMASLDRPLPYFSKNMFVERKVKEPLALTLAGEYDVWDHRGDGDLELQFGLRTQYPEPDWKLLLSYGSREMLPSGNVQFVQGAPAYVDQLIAAGKVAMAYQKHIDASTVKHKSFIQQFEGLKFLAINTARVNSQTFESLDKPETGHDALLAFCWTGKLWSVSMYHAAHRKDIDLSRIAVKFKGGGHAGACGFSCAQPPFPLFPRMA